MEMCPFDQIFVISLILTIETMSTVETAWLMDCGNFFCPNDMMADYADYIDELLEAGISVASPLTNNTLTDYVSNEENGYCCYTVPQDHNPTSWPYCCAWEDYSDNTYERTGLSPTSRTLIAILPAGVAFVITLIAAAYIIHFICGRMESPRHVSPIRRMPSIVAV